METSGGTTTTWAADDTVESAALRHLLDLHPIRLTTAELRRELIGENEEFAARDAVDRAIRELAASGLLHCGDGFVSPTRAALRFEELIGS
jgi:hypothetical protein